jgi:ubiquinone biosynthesis protein UbiJ
MVVNLAPRPGRWEKKMSVTTVQEVATVATEPTEDEKVVLEATIQYYLDEIDRLREGFAENNARIERERVAAEVWRKQIDRIIAGWSHVKTDI